MSTEQLRQIINQLSVSAETLGALGAAMRVRAEDCAVSPALSAQLDEVVSALDGKADLLADVPSEQLMALLPLVRASLLQALDLFDDPGRTAGWTHTDVTLLEAPGRASSTLPTMIKNVIAPQLAGLAARLAEPDAAFLDVGVGVAAVAIGMCQLWPSLRVVGLDPWEPALALARQNVTAAHLADRIDLRRQGVEDLPDRDAFDLVWFPSPFIPRELVEPGIARCVRGLRPGGWLIFGLFTGPGELERSLARLRTVRNCGGTITPPEVETLLTGQGLREVRTLPEATRATSILVVGQRPSG